MLDFVQKPYFTKEDTERERDIIVSEITMYEDDPMWVGHYQMLECMYGKHPIRNRIAGTAETVAEITEETLQRAYACYYTTDEMALVCAGDIPLGEVRRMAERVARRETAARVYFPTEDAEIAEKYRACEMRLSVPQFQIGCKLPPLPKQDWLKNGWRQGSAWSFWRGRAVCFSKRRMNGTGWMRHLVLPFSAARGMPLRHFRAAGRIRRKQRIFWEGSWSVCNGKAFSQEDFQRIRKKHLGQLLRQLDTPQKLCFGQLAWARMDATAIDLLTCIKTMRQEEVGKNAEGRLFKRKYGAFDCEIKRMPSIRLSGGHFLLCRKGGMEFFGRENRKVDSKRWLL